MLVVALAQFLIMVSSRGFVIVRVLSAIHCSIGVWHLNIVVELWNSWGLSAASQFLALIEEFSLGHRSRSIGLSADYVSWCVVPKGPIIGGATLEQNANKID